MSVKVASSFLIHSSLGIRAAFYQQLVTFSDFHRLGRWLVSECEKAQTFRQTEKLQELGLILSGIPVQEYQLIGQFYQAYSRSVENPRKLFEDIVEKSETYKSKALIALATLELQAGNYDSGIKFCTEAIRRTNNVSIMVHAARSISVIKSVEGFHTTALKDLERTAPLVRYASPVAACQYYNSCAVELAEAGRIEEARNISNIVLASPYAFAYPEWRETSDEIALRGYRHSRSVVSLSHNTLNTAKVLHLPLSEQSNSTSSEQHPRSPFQHQASVTVLKAWKEEKMVKEPDDNDAPNDDSEKDLLFGLMELVAKEDFSIDELHKLIKSARKIVSERKSEKGTD